MIDLNQDQLDELREIAGAATQDGWRLVYFIDSNTGEPYADHEAIVDDFRRTVGQSDALIMHGVAVDEADPSRVIAHVGNGPTSEANARFIATFSPTAILALLDALTTATARLAEVTANRDGLDADYGNLVRDYNAEVGELRYQFTAMTQERDAAESQEERMYRQLEDARSELTAARARAEAVEAALREARRHAYLADVMYMGAGGNLTEAHALELTRQEARAAMAVIDAALAPPSTGHDAGGEVGR